MKYLNSAPISVYSNNLKQIKHGKILHIKSFYSTPSATSFNSFEKLDKVGKTKWKRENYKWNYNAEY